VATGGDEEPVAVASRPEIRAPSVKAAEAVIQQLL